MFNFNIRPAEHADITEILNLTVEGINVWGSHIKENMKPWLDATCCPNYIASKMADRDHHIFVAELDGRIVGTVYLNTSDSNKAYMGGLYCSVKKCGLGTILLHHAMEEAVSRNYDLMVCEIYENNVASISLMSKYGAESVSSESFAGVTYVTYGFDLSKVLSFS